METYVISIGGFLIVILLGVITYFLKELHSQQKEFNVQNSKEHTLIFNHVARSEVVHKQIDKNLVDIKELDRRVDEHGNRLAGHDRDIKTLFKKP